MVSDCRSSGSVSIFALLRCAAGPYCIGRPLSAFSPRGVSFPARWGGGPLSCYIGRRGPRGGTIVWRHAVRESGFSALRRAEYRFLRGGAMAAGVLLHKAEAVRCAARFAALSRDPRGAAGTFLSRRIAAGKEKYPEKKPGTLIFSSGAAFKFIKAAVRRPGPRLFFPHLKRRRERKAAQKKGLGSRRSGDIRRTGAAPRAPQSGAQGAAGSEAFEV